MALTYNQLTTLAGQPLQLLTPADLAAFIQWLRLQPILDPDHTSIGELIAAAYPGAVPRAAPIGTPLSSVVR